MKKFPPYVVVLFVGIAFASTGFGQAKEKPAAPEKPAPAIKIYDIMACNVYVDFDADYVDTKIMKEQHKFLISFSPAGKGVFVPDLIDKITAYGPDGYKVEFAVNQAFDAKNKNGYIHDARYGTYWYMVNLDTGFMKEGKYTIEVKCKNGEVLTQSRIQKEAPSKALVSVYVKNKEEICKSHSPSKFKKMPAGTPLKDVKVSWSSLKQLADFDAYYIFRIREGKASRDFDTQNLVWWDNVFAQRFYGHTIYGINKGEVVIGTELKPKTSYVYFTEITDSNLMGDTNICIFQPHQIFITP
jgi:hypothetical protein